jgi:multidrug resistance efflux pump
MRYSHEVGGDCHLVPIQQYGVRAQISDEILTVHVADGEWVEPGSPIATLAVRDERAALNMSKAKLDQAQAELDLLRAGSREEEIAIAEQKVEYWEIQREFDEKHLDRVKSLREDHGASAEELDRAQKTFDLAVQTLASAQKNLERVRSGARQEAIQAAEAEVERLKAELAYHDQMVALGEITAPCAGYVVTAGIRERVGQVVESGELIAVLYNTSEIYAEIAAHEAAAAQVREAMPVNIRLNALDGRLVTGRVESVSRASEDDTAFRVDRFRSDRECRVEEAVDRDERPRVRVQVALDSHGYNLVPGMTGKARIVVGQDRFWRALLRPILRFFRVEVWSWLP